MASRFSSGDTVYDKGGRSYVVEAVDGPTIYCTASNGVETEFPDDKLMTVAEWRAGESVAKHGKREISYPRLRQSRHYVAGATKMPPAVAEHFLARANALFPALLDFAAFTIAARILEEHKDGDLTDQLSIVKSRAVFDDAPAPVRARVLAELLGAQPEALVSAASLGDNLLRAMIDKGLAAYAAAFDDFQDRPRR